MMALCAPRARDSHGRRPLLLCLSLALAAAVASACSGDGASTGPGGTGGTTTTGGSAGTTTNSGGTTSTGGSTTSTGTGGSTASTGGSTTSSGGGGSTMSSGGGGSTGTSSGGGGSTGNSSGGGGSTTTTTSTGGGGVGGGADCSPPSGTVPALKLTQVVGGLARPTFVTASPGDTTRLYVVEQAGVIKLVKNGVVQATPFLDIQSLVNSDNERGLLGLAFHPDYEQNGRFFVHYSDIVTGGAGIVAEYERSANPDVANPVAVGIVLTQPQVAGFHRGGALEFSPTDGMLYIGFGDGGMMPSNGQSLSTWLGKVLRIDVSMLPYSIPPGNMTGAGVLPEIWDYGLRNPWRFRFDPCTGDLYIGDVGAMQWEEVDVEAAGAGNKNYGWNKMEGAHCLQPPVDCDPGNVLTLPAVEYDHITGCSVSGGSVYRGSAIPALRGAYFYADLCFGKVWSFRWSGGSVSDHVERTADLGSNGKNIVAIGQDAAGELYVVQYNMAGGAVYRIDPE